MIQSGNDSLNCNAALDITIPYIIMCIIFPLFMKLASMLGM